MLIAVKCIAGIVSGIALLILAAQVALFLRATAARISPRADEGPRVQPGNTRTGTLLGYQRTARRSDPVA
jgi:hypothetical protein